MAETERSDWRTPEQRAQDMAQAKAQRKGARKGGLRKAWLEKLATEPRSQPAVWKRRNP